MVQPPSQHDEDESLAEFAEERRAVQSRPVDIESVVLWLADTWRAAGRARPLYVGAAVLLIAGGMWLAWRALQPTPPIESLEQPTSIAASPEVEPHVPIQPAAIVPVPPSTPASEPVSAEAAAFAPSASAPKEASALRGIGRRESVESNTPRIEEPRPALVAAPAGNSAERVRRESTAQPSDDASHVSPPMPRPAPPSGPSPSAASIPAPAPQPDPVPQESVPEAAAPVASPKPSEDVAVRDVIGRYRTAVAALDAASVQRVWPSVSQRSLERAFSQIQEQDVFFFSCTIEVKGAGAQGVCVGTTTFIPKVGNRSPQSGPSQWNFSLSKASGGVWQIDNVRAQ